MELIKPEPEVKFRKLTLKEQVAVIDLLRKHCTTTSTGHAKYEQGWDDERIQDTACPEYKGNSGAAASRIRKELFGPLVEKVSTPADNVQRLERCERLIEHLYKLLDTNLPE